MTEENKLHVMPQRLESLDALRGFDMFWIVGGAAVFTSFDKIFDSPATDFINSQLKHVEWTGFSFWDIIMPLFLFIVGAAIPFSIGKRLIAGQTKKELYKHIGKRCIILWILGMVVQGRLLEYDLSRLDIYSNTLQAIASGYLIATVVYLNLNMKWFNVLLVGLLLLFWALMALVPVPGYGAGNLTPAGNLAIYLDKLILGRFEDGLNYTWILSSLNFGATVMLGVIAGKLLKSEMSQKENVMWLTGLGAGFIVIGLVWGIWFPIIKRLWTSSFVLYSGGYCFLLLALFYLIIDVLNYRRWAFFFKVIGMNAIAVYTVTHIFEFHHIGDIFVGGLLNRIGPWDKFVQNLAAFIVVWLILYMMYRKRVFIKI